jgi:HD-GYP domain-containing protein (c-di-GMP phosphodiesterase class II)
MQHCESRFESLRSVFLLQTALAAEADSRCLPAMIISEAKRLLDVDRGSLFLFDGESSELRTAHADGLESGSLVVPLRMGVVGAAILRRHRINIVNAYEHIYFNDAIDQVAGYRSDSLLAEPIINDADVVIGGVQLVNKLGGRFNLADEERVGEFARQLARLCPNGVIDPEIARSEMEPLLHQIGCDRGTIYQLDDSSGELVSVYASGTDHRIRLRIKLGIAGLVALTGQTRVVADAATDPRFDNSFDKRTGYVTRNILTVPLKTGTYETLGAIQLINRHCGGFDAEAIELLEMIAGVAAMTLHNRDLVRDIEVQFQSLLEVMAASLDSRDELTAGHSHRVAEIALRIATAMGFTPEDLDILRVAAMLHDYGKIGVDDAVLRKNGKLDDGEYGHMKQHAGTTHEILEKVRFARKYRSVPLIASSHHEALDGSGYPRGLRGHEIPFMAKILTVADVFEALTADRHYRKGMTPERALAIIDEGVGTKFDERIVEVLRRNVVGAMPSV